MLSIVKYSNIQGYAQGCFEVISIHWLCDSNPTLPDRTSIGVLFMMPLVIGAIYRLYVRHDEL